MRLLYQLNSLIGRAIYRKRTPSPRHYKVILEFTLRTSFLICGKELSDASIYRQIQEARIGTKSGSVQTREWPENQNERIAGRNIYPWLPVN